jgi:hypothetical protein
VVRFNSGDAGETSGEWDLGWVGEWVDGLALDF